MLFYIVVVLAIVLLALICLSAVFHVFDYVGFLLFWNYVVHSELYVNRVNLAVV